MSRVVGVGVSVGGILSEDAVQRPAGIGEHLETRAGEPEPWKPADEEGENAITELAPLVIQIGKAAWQVATVGDEAQRARATEVLAETRRSLYRILAEDAPENEDAEDADASGESLA